MGRLLVLQTYDNSLKIQGKIPESDFFYYGGTKLNIGPSIFKDITFTVDISGNIEFRSSNGFSNDFSDESHYEIISYAAYEIAYDEVNATQGDEADVLAMAEEIEDNIVFDEEEAKKDVMKVLDYVKANIGTTYDEIYSHVSAPPDSLLGIE